MSETRSITNELVESKRISLKSRFNVIKSFPSEISNEQILSDEELNQYLKDFLELNFHTGFSTLGGLEFEEFKVSKVDVKNKEFEFEYKGNLYASLKLLNMLTNTNKEIKEKETLIMQMIDDYYIISRNFVFGFDEKGNIIRNESLSSDANKWMLYTEFDCKKISPDEEDVLNILDKYANEAIKLLVKSIENMAIEEMKNLIGV